MSKKTKIEEITPDALDKDIDEKLMAKLDDLDFNKASLVSVNKSEIEAKKEEDKEALKKNSFSNDVAPYLTKVNEKYGTKFMIDDIKTALEYAALGSRSEREIKRIITDELLASASEFIIFKSILALVKIINGQLDAALKKDYTDELNGDIISTISELMKWVDKFEDIKNRYRQYDIDKKINKLMKTDDFAQANMETTNKLKEILKISIGNSLDI